MKPVPWEYPINREPELLQRFVELPPLRGAPGGRDLYPARIPIMVGRKPGFARRGKAAVHGEIDRVLPGLLILLDPLDHRLPSLLPLVPRERIGHVPVLRVGVQEVERIGSLLNCDAILHSKLAG